MSIEIESAATVFTVQDVEKSLAHYRDVVGFSVEFKYGDPPMYAGVVERGRVLIHLHAAAHAKAQPGQGVIYIFVQGVDELYAEVQSKGARIIKPPRDYPYEMRDFDLHDLDGNRLVFGQSTRKN